LEGGRASKSQTASKMCMELGIQFSLKAKIGKEMCKTQKEKQVAHVES